MNTIQISVSQARGLILASAKSDVRYYLNGTLFDFEAGRAVSTDGHCLLAINVQANCDDPAFDRAIAPRDVLEAIAKGGKVTDTVIIQCDERGITFNRNSTETTCQPIDGKYPDYERVMPDKFSGKTAHYDPVLIARTCKALALGIDDAKASAYIAQNGDKAALVTIPGQNVAIALVMPWRVKDYNPAAELAAFNAVKPAKPEAKPVKKTPQVAAIAGMTPLGITA